MTLDLSKARVGDTVKFRCGGEAVIKSIFNMYPDGGNPYKYQIHFEGDTYPDEKMYQTGGTRRGTGVVTQLDIVDHVVKEFDWKDVRAGMAFISVGSSPWIYIAQHPVKKDQGVFYGTTSDMEHRLHLTGLTRAPEHDIQP